jgi:hypothetical protein
MRKSLIASLTLVLVVALTAAFTQANEGFNKLGTLLTGYEEVNAISTPGNGVWTARINRDETRVDWELTYGDTETPVTQSHIHFNARALNGPVIVFFCTNLGNGPVGTQPCPPNGGTISGSFGAADVGAGGTAAGIAPGELGELIAAIRAGATYANVHTTGRPGGEIRGQIGRADASDDHGGHR